MAPGAPIIAGMPIVMGAPPGDAVLVPGAAPPLGVFDDGVVLVGVVLGVVGLLTVLAEAFEPAVACGAVELDGAVEAGCADSGSLPHAAAAKHSSAAQCARGAPLRAQPPKLVRSRIAHTSARMNKVMTRSDAISAESWWILS
jgi:hypothetical protein